LLRPPAGVLHAVPAEMLGHESPDSLHVSHCESHGLPPPGEHAPPWQLSPEVQNALSVHVNPFERLTHTSDVSLQV
jgi:hypothetical protein